MFCILISAVTSSSSFRCLVGSGSRQWKGRARIAFLSFIINSPGQWVSLSFFSWCLLAQYLAHCGLVGWMNEPVSEQRKEGRLFTGVETNFSEFHLTVTRRNEGSDRCDHSLLRTFLPRPQRSLAILASPPFSLSGYLSESHTQDSLSSSWPSSPIIFHLVCGP